MDLEQLRTDSTFLAFVTAWESEGRCPLPAVDYLLECGLEEEAEAVRWAATEDRKWVCREKEESGQSPMCGLYPCDCQFHREGFSWYETGRGQHFGQNAAVPSDLFRYLRFSSDTDCTVRVEFLDAVIDLIRAYTIARPSKPLLEPGDDVYVGEGGKAVPRSRLHRGIDTPVAVAVSSSGSDNQFVKVLMLNDFQHDPVRLEVGR